MRRACVLLGAILCAGTAAAEGPRVVDVPTRPGVTQRFLYVPAADAKAAAILFAGGHGGLAIDASGAFAWGAGNFLVRSRALFAERGVSVAVIDAPSDRQAQPWLGGFRQTPEHAADVRAVVAWLRNEIKRPVWLVGTSRGTQSAAATALAGVGADGLVLTSTILVDPRGRPVLGMPVERLAIPVLVVHHKDDGCAVTPYAQTSALVARLTGATRKSLVTLEGGKDTGDPCEAFAHHGFPGLERDVVDAIVAFMLAK
ncbi:MAG: alpha/beta hydrolase [Betaproteobacteria bacterium]